MTAIAGHNSRLRLGDGATPVQTFNEIAGVEVTDMQVTRDAPDVRQVGQGAFATRHANQGTIQVQLTARGYADNGAVHTALRGHALSGTLATLQLEMHGGEIWQGDFTVRDYESSAAQDGLRKMRLVCESAGTVSSF